MSKKEEKPQTKQPWYCRPLVILAMFLAFALVIAIVYSLVYPSPSRGYSVPSTRRKMGGGCGCAATPQV